MFDTMELKNDLPRQGRSALFLNLIKVMRATSQYPTDSAEASNLAFCEAVAYQGPDWTLAELFALSEQVEIVRAVQVEGPAKYNFDSLLPGCHGDKQLCRLALQLAGAYMCDKQKCWVDGPNAGDTATFEMLSISSAVRDPFEGVSDG